MFSFTFLLYAPLFSNFREDLNSMAFTWSLFFQEELQKHREKYTMVWNFFSINWFSDWTNTYFQIDWKSTTSIENVAEEFESKL